MSEQPLDPDAIEARSVLQAYTVSLQDAKALLAEVRRLRAENTALWAVARAGQMVWDQSYVCGADGWEGVEAVPMGWENALYRLGALLTKLPPREEARHG